MDQKRARKGLGRRQAWHACDVSASPEQGEVGELAGVTYARQVRPSSAYWYVRAQAYGEIIPR